MNESVAFLVFCGGIVLLLALMLGLPQWLAPRRRRPADNNPFESGILPAHGTDIRFPSQFYLIAMFFVIFDLEVVFVFGWALAVRQAGWTGYAGILGFLGLLLLALAYLWRAGGLEWRPRAGKMTR